MLTLLHQIDRSPKLSSGVRGMGLMEAVLAMAILVILGLGFAIAVPAAVDGAREDAVRDRLLRLKRGIGIGTPASILLGARNVNPFRIPGRTWVVCPRRWPN